MLMIFIIKVTAHNVHVCEREYSSIELNSRSFFLPFFLSLAFCLQAIEYFSHFSILCYCALLLFPPEEHVSADTHACVCVSVK